MRLHTDHTLDIMDRLTTTLGEDARKFMSNTCGAFETRELQKEYKARIWRQPREAAQKAKAEAGRSEGKDAGGGGKGRDGKGQSKGDNNSNAAPTSNLPAAPQGPGYAVSQTHGMPETTGTFATASDVQEPRLTRAP